MTRYDVTQEQVVEAWTKARTAQEAADALGMPKAILLGRVSEYRGRGIKLKAMKRGRPPIDVDALNELAASLGETTEPAPRVKPHNTPEDVAAIMKALVSRMEGKGTAGAASK